MGDGKLVVVRFTKDLAMEKPNEEVPVLFKSMASILIGVTVIFFSLGLAFLVFAILFFWH